MRRSWLENLGMVERVEGGKHRMIPQDRFTFTDKGRQLAEQADLR